MTARLRAIAIAAALFALGAGRQLAQASPPLQERLPGFDGYCPLVVRAGDSVTFRVSVANVSTETGRGTLTELRIPPGLLLDEASVRVVPGAGVGRFSPRAAASAAAGTAWASTDADDAWRSYTLVATARVASTAVGEQLAVALSKDSAGTLIRRVDGVVYAQFGGSRAQAAAIVIDMGVPEVCKAESTPTPTATATATPTSTPVPPPYFVKRLALIDVEGSGFSLAVVCVIDPGQQSQRAPAIGYQISLEAPVNARVALAFGASPNIAGDGRIARFVVTPGASAIRVAIASRPATGEPAWRAPIVPSVRVSADGFGDLAERSIEPGVDCDADPALAPALVSAERASQAARALANAGADEATRQPSPTGPATPSALPAAAAPPTTVNAISVTGPIAPAQAATPPAGDPEMPRILPDPRSIMLPLMCGAGLALASLAFAFLARRHGGNE